MPHVSKAQRRLSADSWQNRAALLTQPCVVSLWASCLLDLRTGEGFTKDDVIMTISVYVPPGNTKLLLSFCLTKLLLDWMRWAVVCLSVCSGSSICRAWSIGWTWMSQWCRSWGRSCQAWASRAPTPSSPSCRLSHCWLLGPPPS